MHARSTIKAMVKQMLTAQVAGEYPTAAGQNVWPQRFRSVPDNKLPAVLIYILEEDVSEFDVHRQRRVAKLIIEALAVDQNGPGGIEIPADDVLDVLSNQIEKLFIDDETILGSVDTALLTKVDIGFDDESTREVLSCRMSYDVVYYSDKTVSSGNDPFESVGLVIGESSEDDITIPQE